jgi:rRNA maturation protein Nop10
MNVLKSGFLSKNIKVMVDYSEVYTYSDQPTTCPKCGSRTEIKLDLYFTKEQIQQHKCLSVKCGYEFVMQNCNSK